jgi:hypothetical protein
MKWPVIAAAGGIVVGFLVCKVLDRETVVTVATPPIVDVDTIEVLPRQMIDSIAKLNKELEKKPKTKYIYQEILVLDSFPYPVFVKDTSSRFWWVEQGTFGQKPNSVTTVVTREPFSGRATVLRYITPGPVESFVVDTNPRPRITFGKFIQPKKRHGLLTDIGLVLGSFGGGFLTSQVTGCIGQND